MTSVSQFFSPFSDDELNGPRAQGILIVDDDPAVRAQLAEELPRHGFAVWLAETGGEAVELYQQHHDAIDLVLLDSRLLDWEGQDTLSALRGLDPSVRCCFMANFLDHQEAAQLFDQGAAGILTKPFRADGLAAALHLLTLGHRRCRQLCVP
jgi:DNA-binding response OmpR family regulator